MSATSYLSRGRTNPIYAQYSKAMNTVILGQAISSRKSNTGGKRISATEPVCFRREDTQTKQETKITIVNVLCFNVFITLVLVLNTVTHHAKPTM